MAKVNVDLSGLLPHQRKLIKSKARKSALICGRGAGKSFVCAVLCLLVLLMGRNVLIGGQRYDTLHDTLYDEIKKIAALWGIYDYIEWRERPMMMTLGDAHVWFGTYESVDAVRGYSRVSLILLDEMFLAPANILAVWGPCMRAAGGNTRIVGATTPRLGSMWNVLFSDPKCDWEKITASTMDNDKISKDELDLILSEIHDENMYKQEILGHIFNGLGAAAIVRLEEFPRLPGFSTDQRVIAGLDCADGVERDCTAFFKRRGNTVLEMWELNGIDHEECVRKIRESNRREPIDELNMDHAFSDYEYNVLKYEIPCEQVNFARAPSEEMKGKYGNVRAEMFFNLAWYVRHGLCVDGFEKSGELKRQLCAMTWYKDNQERLMIVKKDELKAVLKRSPDTADAAALTCLHRYAGDDPSMNVAMNSNAGVTSEEIESMMAED